MTTTRRNAVKFIAGSAVGAMFTPAPWHFIRDTALWSENWPGIPEPKHGPVTFKTAQCTASPGVRKRSDGTLFGDRIESADVDADVRKALENPIRR